MCRRRAASRPQTANTGFTNFITALNGFEMPAHVLLRPAIIELRYADETKFKAAVSLYEGLLYDATEEAPADNVRTFRTGYSMFANHRDMLLRLTYPFGGASGSDQTVLYWKVKGTDISNLTTLHESLTSSALISFERPAEYGTSTITTGPPARSILQDTISGTLVGLTINPPVPTATMSDENGSAFNPFDWLKARGSILSLLLVPMVGFGGLMFGRRQGREQERQLGANGFVAGPQGGRT